MSLVTALILIAVGILLILIELFLIPGVGVAGIIGFVLMLAGVVGAFYVNTGTGIGVLIGTIVIGSWLLYLSFRSDTWERFSIRERIDSKANQLDTDALQVGTIGQAVSRINPMGKARFGVAYEEVITRNDYIEENMQIRIMSIEGNKIYVERHDTTS